MEGTKDGYTQKSQEKTKLESLHTRVRQSGKKRGKELSLNRQRLGR